MHLVNDPKRLKGIAGLHWVGCVGHRASRSRQSARYVHVRCTSCNSAKCMGMQKCEVHVHNASGATRALGQAKRRYAGSGHVVHGLRVDTCEVHGVRVETCEVHGVLGCWVHNMRKHEPQGLRIDFEHGLEGWNQSQELVKRISLHHDHLQARERRCTHNVNPEEEEDSNGPTAVRTAHPIYGYVCLHI